MRVLVVVASRHGATRGIAEVLRDELAQRGCDAVLAAAADAPPPEAFDVVVLGSAVYVGRWMEEAKRYAERHRDTLRARPVYLFSSGPLGDPPKPDEDPADAAALRDLTGAREHATFAGKLDRAGLSLAEKAMARLVKAPEGDYRAWNVIRAWAAGIARRHAAPGASA